MPYSTNTKDPVREFLDSVRTARVEYNRLSEKIRGLEAQCMSVTATLSATPGGGGGGDAEKMWAALADESARLYPLLKAAMEQERRVENFIDRIPNDSYRLMLKLRYLDCLSWERVQELLSRSGVFYSDRHIYRLHGEALEAARRLWAQDNKEEKS